MGWYHYYCDICDEEEADDLFDVALVCSHRDVAVRGSGPDTGEGIDMGYETREEVAAKIEWEGGLEETFRYGLKVTDLPEGDIDLRVAWTNAQLAFDEYDYFADEVMRLLEDYL